VVEDLPWRQTITLAEDRIPAEQRAGKLCFVPYEFEHGCEDRALLPDVLSFIDAHERVFLYQEFIWGHDSSYNRASGRTNTDYYSGYLDAVVEHLEAKGLLDRTLVVLTSDHGFRDTALQGETWVYHIPLWFFSTRFDARSDARLFSHLDFGDLLAHELGAPRAPDPDPFVMVVGPTGTGMLAVLTEEQEFMLFKTRGERRFLLRHDPARSLDAAAPPVGYLKLFDEYRASFDTFGATFR